MKRMALVCLLFTLPALAPAQADDGRCIALGRTGGEDIICRGYDDTDETKCRAADGHAWCAWESTWVRGSGPIRVKCSPGEAKPEVYYVNSLTYTGGKAKTLVAMGFGPNRGDEGFKELEGFCQISPKAQASAR